MVSKRKQPVLLFSPDQQSAAWEHFYDLEEKVTEDLRDREDTGGSMEECENLHYKLDAWPFPRFSCTKGVYKIIKPKKAPLPEGLF